MSENDPTSIIINKIKDKFNITEQSEVVPPIFLLGESALSQEVVIGEHRIRTWPLFGNEVEMSSIAGWGLLPFEVDKESNAGALYIPEGTRNAESVLAGTEAWKNEKRELVDFVLKYFSDISKVYTADSHDVNLTWSSVGVTPSHDFFIAPPNEILMNDSSSKTTSDRLTERLALLLSGDKKNKHLASKFSAQIIGDYHNGNTGNSQATSQ